MHVTLPAPSSSTPGVPAAVWHVALGGPRVSPWPVVMGGTGGVELPTIGEDQTTVDVATAEEFALAVLAAAHFARLRDADARLEAATAALSATMNATPAEAGGKTGWFRSLADAHTTVARAFETYLSMPGEPADHMVAEQKSGYHHSAARRARLSAEHEVHQTPAADQPGRHA